MNPDLTSFTALLSFTSNPSTIVSPFPPSVPIKPLAKTSFEISPFMEKVTRDPYAVTDLSILSQTELQIDNVIDYVSTIVPPELLAELEKLPDLAKYLLDEGLSLPNVLMEISTQLPTSLSLSDLLRAVPIMDVIHNINSFLGAITNLGLNILTIPANIIITGMSIMSSVLNLVGSVVHTASYIATTAVNTALGITTAIVNPIAKLALGIAMIGATTTHTIAATGFLLAKGISNIAHMVAFVVNTPSIFMAIISHGIKMIGTTLSKSIIFAVNHISAVVVHAAVVVMKSINDLTNIRLTTHFGLLLGYTNTLNLYNIMSVHTDVCVRTAHNLVTYNYQDIDVIASSVYTNGNIATHSIITVISGYSIADALGVLEIIKAQGVGVYLSNDHSGTYQPLIDNVNTYGIDAVFSLTTAVNNISSVDISTIVDDTTTLGLDSIRNMINVVTATTPNTLLDTVTQMQSSNLMTIGATLTQMDIVGAQTLSDLTDAATTVGIDNLNTFTDTLTKVDTNNISNSIDIINKLTDTDISDIGTFISNTEPYTILSNLNIDNDLMEIAIKKTCEVCAKAGNYHMVINLLNNYSGNISVGYRRYLVSVILNNYKITLDDNTIGLKLAGQYFAQGLYSIYNLWDIDTRNNEVVSLLSPLLTATKDSLTLLSKYPQTAIPAILQLDNQYKLAA